jgi:hypothetical protein
MQRRLVVVSYLVAVALLIVWLTTAYPTWVLVVSVLIFVRSGFINMQRASHD